MTKHLPYCHLHCHSIKEQIVYTHVLNIEYFFTHMINIFSIVNIIFVDTIMVSNRKPEQIKWTLRL